MKQQKNRSTRRSSRCTTATLYGMIQLTTTTTTITLMILMLLVSSGCSAEATNPVLLFSLKEKEKQDAEGAAAAAATTKRLKPSAQNLRDRRGLRRRASSDTKLVKNDKVSTRNISSVDSEFSSISYSSNVLLPAAVSAAASNSVASRITSIVQSSGVTPSTVLRDSRALQNKALLWMTTLDNYAFRRLATSAVLQRYAMAVLDFSLHGSEATDAPAMMSRSSDHECDWRGVSCDSSNNVVKIVWVGLGLSGRIPDEIKILAPSLKYLDLGENQITGSIIEPIFDLTNLEELFLHSNRLTGTLSESFSKLEKLTSFYGCDNMLEGPLPVGLGSKGLGRSNARQLRRLSLFKNKLSGPIPSNLNWRKMWYLDLSDNYFGGTIPNDWVTGDDKLFAIRFLYLDHNQLDGELPELWPTLGDGRLEVFQVNDNYFTGYVAGDYQYRNKLQTLQLHHNSFSGMDTKLCGMFVFFGGEMTSFRADCLICRCRTICDQCD